MKVIRDIVYVRADKHKHSKRKFNDSEIIIDTVFNPDSTENSCQDGEVVHIPSKLSNGKKIDVSPGDHVYGSHNLTHDDNADDLTGERLYRAEYEHTLYLKIKDGKIHMLNDWVLVKPIVEEESNYKTESGIWIKPNADHLALQGELCHLNEETRELGLKEGDNIFFSNDSEYEINVEGETYYRMKNEDIIGKNDEKL